MKLSFILFLFTLTFIYSCASSSSIILNIEGQTFNSFEPPGTCLVDTNFYADQNEISVIDYQEYLFWLKIVYGDSSTSYLAALPDMSVWLSIDKYFHKFTLGYINHPAYVNYPIVGISLEQATAYTDWRTDRVGEMLLVKMGIMNYIPEVTPKTHFTLQRYKEGTCTGIVKHQSVMLPIYKIPNAQEWEFLAKGNSHNSYGIDSTDKWTRTFIKKERCLYNTKEYQVLLDTSRTNPYNSKKKLYHDYKGPSYYFSFTSNSYDLYGIIGSVAEMVQEDSIAKGGSWRHTMNESKIENSIPFIQPNAWTGFRNICHWHYIKIPKKTNRKYFRLGILQK